jgi:HlyD family secretion protein
VSLFVAGCLLISGGCEPEPSATSIPQSALAAAEGTVILAQGRLQPADGVVAISAAPGDQVHKIFPSTGASVEIGAVLMELASLPVREAEIRAAQAKRREAEQQIAIARSTAEVRLQGAKIQLKSAQLSLAKAKLGGEGLEQLRRELNEATRVMDELRQAAQDPNVAALIGQGTLNRQELSVQSAKQQSTLKTAEAQAALETAELAVQAADQEIEAAKMALEAADGSAQLAALDEQLKVLDLQLRASRILSPIRGTVVSIDTAQGQATTPAPLMQLANTDKMICRAEVNVADLRRLQVGASASVSSPALGTEPLQGKVQAISQLIGVPRLPDPNPMARSDWRAAIVEIAIDPSQTKQAAARINLQVDVTIAVSPAEQSVDSTNSPKLSE